MKIASGSVDLGKAYSGLFVFHLSVFPDDSNLERGSFFSEEYCFKAFQHRRLFFLTFFSSTHDIFENKYLEVFLSSYSFIFLMFIIYLL